MTVAGLVVALLLTVALVEREVAGQRDGRRLVEPRTGDTVIAVLAAVFVVLLLVRLAELAT